MNARALALAALQQWRQTQSFADAIIQRLLGASRLSGSDRGFATELFYGVLRNLTLLDFWIGQLRSGNLDHGSRDLLRLGLYQLLILRTPSHAAVFETVQLSGRRNRGLINGMLRNAMRREAELARLSGAQPLATRASHPEFLLERWSRTFGEDAAATLANWDNEPPRIYARVNRLRASAIPVETEPLNGFPNFFRVHEMPFAALERGEIYVQDPSTSVACELLAPEPHERVLDACAAPGGKTTYLAELMQNSGQLMACDRELARVALLRENINRLGVTCATVLQHDWTAPALPAELQTERFDRILLDAPCSNTGVMRRRVDVRWRLQPADFLRMQHQQLAIVRAVVPLLRPGGVFVYSTCSIEPEENEAVVQRVVAEFPRLKLEQTRNVLPFRDGFDGAYAARLVASS